MPRIPFAEYLPDRPDLGSGTRYANNVIPAAESYRPLSALSAVSDALTARCQGALSVIADDGTVSTFAGDATKLYKETSNSFADVSRSSGGAYATASDGMWSFAKFGSIIIACNGVDVPQAYTIGSSSVFAALSGSPPTGRYVAVVGNFVTIADNGSGNRQQVRWSGINNATSWTTSAATQADSQTLPGEGGFVMGVVGYEQGGVVFQERAIWRMDYIGPPAVFQFSNVEPGRGALASGSIAQVGRLIFFLAEDGFYVFDGNAANPIGAEKVNRSFFSDLDKSYLDRITCAVDVNNNVVMWAYPGSGNTNGTPNRCIMYNWVVGRWSTGDITTEYLVKAFSSGYTINGLDNLSSTIDGLPFPVDSRVYAGGVLTFGGFTTAHKLGYFSGSALQATLETGEFAPGISGARSFVDEIWPIVDGGSPSIVAYSRVRPNDDPVIGITSSQNTNGACYIRTDSRYFRIRMTQPAGEIWDNALGVELEPQPSGYR